METENRKSRRYGGRGRHHWYVLLFLMRTLEVLLKLTRNYERGARNAWDITVREIDVPLPRLPAAFDGFTGPPQNVVWASRSGSIGWRPAGLLPVRREGLDGSVPCDGSDPANDWRGFVPMEELPRVVDPPEGFVVTANQRTIGTAYPYFVSADWGHPGRARRIHRRRHRPALGAASGPPDRHPAPHGYGQRRRLQPRRDPGDLGKLGRFRPR